MGRGTVAQGSSYAANEASALRWVHATLVESALISHDLVLPPLTAAEREAITASRLMAAMFGYGAKICRPPGRLFASTPRPSGNQGDVAVTPAARRMAEQVLAGAPQRLRPPGWYGPYGAAASRRACQFDLPIRDRDRRLCDRMLLVLRRIYPAAPARLLVGPYQEAMARVSRGAGPDLLTRGLNRLWIGQPAMPDAAPAVGTRRAVG